MLKRLSFQSLYRVPVLYIFGPAQGPIILEEPDRRNLVVDYNHHLSPIFSFSKDII